DGTGDGVDRSRRVPVLDEALAEAGPLGAGADEAHLQVPPAQGGVAQDHVLGVVVGHDVDVGAGGQGLQHGLRGRCVVQVDAGDLAGELAGAVELPGPRVDEVDGQRVPGEDACELQAHVPGPEDRDG